MSTKSLRLGFLVFFALSGYVSANLLLMQSKMNAAGSLALTTETRTKAPIETAALRARRIAVLQTGPTAGQKEKGARAPSWRGVRTVNEDATLSPGKIGVRGRFLPVETGNSVELVKALQRELKTKGYDPGAEDGRAGVVTRAAIFAYQYDHGMGLTAEPTETVLQAVVLGQTGGRPSAKRQRSPVSESAKELVRLTQKGLKQQGFWAAALDGKFDLRLSRTIQAFETSQHLPATGRISGRFMARLIRLSGVRQAALR